MKNSVLRRYHVRASVLILDDPFRLELSMLAELAEGILIAQDSTLWSDASAPTFLEELKQGALALQRIARCSHTAVEDLEAHQAFMVCLLLAMGADCLPSELRTALSQVLSLLAECCPVRLEPMELPPLSKLRRGLRHQSMVRKHYAEMLLACAPHGPGYKVTLADALRILRAIERVPSLDLAPLIFSLREVTEGFRVALDQIEAVEV